MRKKILIIILLFGLFVTTSTKLHAADSAAVQDLQNKIKQYQTKLDELQKQKSSLSQEIQYMDTQISLTTLTIQQTEQKIVTTQKEIGLLTNRIDGLDSSLDTLSKVFLKRVVANYKKPNVTFFDMLLDSNNANDFINKYKYQKTVQSNNEKLVLQVQEAKQNFEEQKSLREKKKVQLDQLSVLLEQQKDALDSQKVQKQKLLADTNSDEATYQRLLSQAKAQLAGFSNFVSSQGGASLLSNQTHCDDWGCYYSQRDSQWGGNSLNGTGYTLASDGCLVTSVAMVFTHYGHRSVTPQTINSNPNNFASYFPAYLLYTVSADGVSASRVSAQIDSSLSNGDPVIVGVRAYGGTHFVVLKSGSGGNYTMHDPYVSDGHDISFTDHYSMGSIFEIDKMAF